MELIGGVLVVPVIVGLVEVAKRSGVPARWAPALALCLGVVVGLIGQPGTGEWAVSTLQGVALGLAASGLYSGVRATAEGSVKGEPSS